MYVHRYVYARTLVLVRSIYCMHVYLKMLLTDAIVHVHMSQTYIESCIYPCMHIHS